MGLWRRCTQIILILSFSWSLLFCAARVQYWEYSGSRLIKCSQERMYGALMLKDMRVSYEHWSNFTVTSSAVSTIQSDPSFLWRGRVRENSKQSGLFYRMHRVCLSASPWGFGNDAELCPRNGASVRVPYFYNLADVKARKSSYGHMSWSDDAFYPLLEWRTLLQMEAHTTAGQSICSRSCLRLHC